MFARRGVAVEPAVRRPLNEPLARPGLLFKYQPATDQAIENLQHRQLWLTPPHAFNDPYDCALHVFQGQLTDEQLQRWFEWMQENDPFDPQALEEIRQADRFTHEAKEVIHAAMSDAFSKQRDELLATVGVTCLSEKFDDLLMWGHYASGHRGFCIGFDAAHSPFDHADRVEYVDHIPRVDPMSVLQPTTRGSYIKTMLLTKAKCWSYEGEWRILSRHPGTPAKYRANDLKIIYLGAAAAETTRARISAIAKSMRVPVRSMRALVDRFHLAYDGQ